jgi:alkylation response protein AidB-like acyl-CoA dehydrogenase
MATAALSDAFDRVRALGPAPADCAAESERLGLLAPAAIEAIHESGLFRMLLPLDVGGLGLTVPEGAEILRAVSAYDGSSGWVFTILSNGPLFVQFLARSAFDEIFADPRSTICSGINPLATRAVPVEGGYAFSGSAPYASGCRHADWLVAGAWVRRDGRPSFVDGGPELVTGVMPLAEARIEDTWSTSGMRATGSNDCFFEDVFIAEERTFDWNDPVPRFDVGPSGHIPLFVQLGGGISGCVVGIARRHGRRQDAQRPRTGLARCPHCEPNTPSSASAASRWWADDCSASTPAASSSERTRTRCIRAVQAAFRGGRVSHIG